MYINISDEAQSYFCKLLAAREETSNIRIFVTDPGTTIAECGVAFCTEDDIESDDHTLTYDGFLVYIDAMSWPFLAEAEIDYLNNENDGDHSLTMKAPNARMKKVADDAPIFDRLNYLIQSVINPQLASHGGNIALIDIEENHAILEFGGGCNGCALLDVTLKDGVEKQILEAFPGEIIGVKDVTDHVIGAHSYY